MMGKRSFGDWLKVLLLLLDEVAVLVIIFLALRFWDVPIPLPMAIFVAIPIAVVVLIIHIKIIPSFHQKQATGREGMLGLEGRVVQPLTPVGTIYVKGENWKAKSIGDIEVDEPVEVIGIEGLMLTVRRLNKE